MREKEIEQKLVQAVKKSNGLCLKLTSPSMAGIPDRLLLMMGGKCAFVELKAPGKKLRPLQLSRKRQLEKFGFHVYVIDSMEQISEVLSEIEGDSK